MKNHSNPKRLIGQLFVMFMASTFLAACTNESMSQPSGTQILIRIMEDGTVKITDGKGNLLKQGRQLDPKKPWDISDFVKEGKVKRLDQAIWFTGSPGCVMHGSREYCNPPGG